VVRETVSKKPYSNKTAQTFYLIATSPKHSEETNMRIWVEVDR